MSDTLEDQDNNTISTTEEEKLCSKTKSYLDDRQQWEKRQDVFYRMRNHGLRRLKKPFPNAADLHYPLIDTAIDKMTPFYLQQFQGAAMLAEFIATDGDAKNDAVASSTAERFFDYTLRQKTNFEDELEPLIDSMLLGGRAILKIRWDSDTDSLDFDSLDPLFFIVPPMTKQLQKAEFVTEVIQLSPSQYRAIDLYKQDEDFVKRLSVKGDENGDNDNTNDTKYVREGITEPKDSTIVLWQTFKKEIVEESYIIEDIDEFGNIIEIEETEKVKRVKVYTYAPHMPDEPVREAFTLPYSHNQYPFVDFPREAKEKRWYSPRGISERLAPFEAYLCKVWNEKADAMTFYNNPIYASTTSSIGNLSNIKFTPGSVLSTPVTRIDSGSPPVSFDQEMINTRMAAEALEQVPDFGMTQQTNTSERRTATEIQAISSLSSASQDARASLFRKRLREVYRQSWSLIQDYAKDLPLNYIHNNTHATVDPALLEKNFEVAPSGATNAWNKQYHANIALQMLQMFKGDPSINQIALKKSVIENLAPSKLTELIIDPIHEQEIKRIFAELQQADQQGIPVSPQARQEALAQIQEHFQAIKQANPEYAQQLAMQLQQAQQAPQGQQQGQSPQGGQQQAQQPPQGQVAPQRNNPQAQQQNGR